MPNTEHHHLAQLQRWMQSVVTHPDGVAAGIASPGAREEIDVALEDIETVVTRSNALSSVERLHVYANAYYARLLECLAEEFPALVHALGDDGFGGLAFGYLQDSPSTSYTLCDLGSRFPDYLEKTRPPRDEEDTPDWADFLIDLARLHRLYSEVFDGPGLEKRALLQTDDLLAVPPDCWDRVRFEFAPCFRLVTFRFPVHEYASAVRLQQEAEVPEAADTFLAISRIDYRVRRWSLDREQHALLSSLAAGEGLADAIAASVAVGDVDLESIARQLRSWFAEWAAGRFFVGVRVDD